MFTFSDPRILPNSSRASNADPTLGSTEASSIWVAVPWPAASDNSDNTNLTENGEKITFWLLAVNKFCNKNYFNIKNKKRKRQSHTRINFQSNSSWRELLYGTKSSLSHMSLSFMRLGVERPLCWGPKLLGGGYVEKILSLAAVGSCGSGGGGGSCTAAFALTLSAKQATIYNK